MVEGKEDSLPPSCQKCTRRPMAPRGRGGNTALDGASGAFLMAARQEPLSRPRCSVHPFSVKLKI